MLNEQAYCPRLAYLEWVQGEFAHNADTLDGQFQHRNVNVEAGELPDPDEPVPERLHARSVLLSAPNAGLIARMDLIEADGMQVTPIDYKRGRAPALPERSWEPERVQLCAQALILEENGYQVERGILYFVASRQRVEVVIDDELRLRTRELLAELRRNGELDQPPPPLVDSPKCPRCSLVGICLPDETNLLRGGPDEEEADPERSSRARRLIPSRDDALPLYVQSAGAKVGRSGAELTVTTQDGTKSTVRMSRCSATSRSRHKPSVISVIAASRSSTSRPATGSRASREAWITRTWSFAGVSSRRRPVQIVHSRSRSGSSVSRSRTAARSSVATRRHRHRGRCRG
jgi:CRISPR-associated protein Cas1